MPRIRYESALSNTLREYSISIPEKYTHDTEMACSFMLRKLPKLISSIIKRSQKKKKGYGFKCQIRLQVDFEKFNWDRNEMMYTSPWFIGSTFSTVGTSMIVLQDKVSESIMKMMQAYDSFVRGGSGWHMKRIQNIEIKMIKYKLFTGGCAAVPKLPAEIRAQRSCLTLTSVPEGECFLYAVAAGVRRLAKNAERSFLYKADVDELKKIETPTPTTLKGVAIFERKSNISVNIFTISDNIVHPIYHTGHKNKPYHVNLLLYKNHYFTIRNMSALIGAKIRKSKSKIKVCSYCLSYTVSKTRHQLHKKLCQENLQRLFVAPENSQIYFQAFDKMLPAPFVIYFDIESICLPLEPTMDKTSVSARGKHIPISISALRICRSNPKMSSKHPFLHTGLDCVQKFFKWLDNQSFIINTMLKKYSELFMSEEDEIVFQDSKKCHFCDVLFEKEGVKKCRDHCHLSGKYRMALCDSCNLNRADQKKFWKVFVFAHGLQNYDSHFLIEQCYTFRKSSKDIFMLPKSEEKILTFSMGCFQFKDSLGFLNASLSTLVDLLKTKGSNKFTNMRRYMPSSEVAETMLRKGVFPYSYFDSVKKLKERQLPPKKAFFNDLTGRHISDAEYSFARMVWKDLDCRNFQDYMEAYLATDVCLLADVYENFRSNCMRDYELDPAHYLSSAHFTFDAFMRKTRCIMDKFHDADHYLFVNRAIRGGVSMICRRHAQANNKYMTNFNPKEPSSYIIYLDANNLYGWAMSQYLPTGGLRWMNSEELNIEQIMSTPDDGDIGYFVQVTLTYPHELHDRHSDFPLAPTHDKIHKTKLSPYAKYVVNKHKLTQGVNTKKLFTTFFTREEYIVHYRVLKFYIQHGLKVSKIHAGLAFKQEKVMESYISFNSAKRAASTNDFDSQFYKLLSNSLFGKSIERIDKKVTGVLVTDAERLTKLAAKPTLKSACKINEKLVSVILRHGSLKLDKPSFLGPAILDLAKLKIYDFHYNKIKKYYGDKAKLLFTDTDSLMYHVDTDDVYEDMRIMDDGSYFDFSSYPKDHPNYSINNKRIPGFFKDETAGRIITEFVGLRSKMYCFCVQHEDGIIRDGKAAKGVPKNIVEDRFNMNRYLEALNEDGRQSDTFKKIQSKKHSVYTEERCKVTLCAFDDKRYLLDRVRSVPYGHYRLLL